MCIELVDIEFYFKEQARNDHLIHFKKKEGNKNC